jgi:hypothetical protein
MKKTAKAKAKKKVASSVKAVKYSKKASSQKAEPKEEISSLFVFAVSGMTFLIMLVSLCAIVKP